MMGRMRRSLLIKSDSKFYVVVCEIVENEFYTEREKIFFLKSQRTFPREAHHSFDLNERISVKRNRYTLCCTTH